MSEFLVCVSHAHRHVCCYCEQFSCSMVCSFHPVCIFSEFLAIGVADFGQLRNGFDLFQQTASLINSCKQGISTDNSQSGYIQQTTSPRRRLAPKHVMGSSFRGRR
ncbi:hypothetical protein GDO81_001081 [Engystomops pustulosus]|uniref:Uncharacterized protein n=1 Tax=Engystomops pustulosus TaxID=76066 RepID=A0AAV7D9H5_ENGPU|nr:hypothetical protein GDO81_001081 [Engystomops pustulosus]